MINLLPYAKQNEIKAGRSNVTIVNYILITIGGLILLSLIIAGAYATLVISRNGAQTRVNDTDQQAAKYASTEQAASEYRSSLSTAKQIIGSQINYASLLIKIAQDVPSGVKLDSLTLTPTSFGQPMTVAAHAQTYDDAFSLKDSFSKDTTLFSSVSLIDLQGGATGGYPVSISLSVVLNKGAIQ